MLLLSAWHEPSPGRGLATGLCQGPLVLTCSFSRPLVAVAHRCVGPWNLDTIPALRGPPVL